MLLSQEMFQKISSLFRSSYSLLFSLSPLHMTYLRLRFSTSWEAIKLLKVACDPSFHGTKPFYQRTSSSHYFSLKTYLVSHSFLVASHHPTYFIGLDRIVLGSLETNAIRIYLLWASIRKYLCVLYLRCA